MIRKEKKRYDWDAYLLVGPALIIFTAFVFIPAVSTFRLSLFDWNGLGIQKFICFENFINLFQDENFIKSVKVTLIWMVVSTTLSVLIGWGIALISGLLPRRSAPIHTAIFMAYCIPSVVTGIIWIGIYDQDSGLLNSILSAFGNDKVTLAWLGHRGIALGAVLVAFIWIQIGLPLVNCFAAIRAIPESIIEAAKIDGVSKYQMIYYIFLPLSIHGMAVSVFINLLTSLKAFDIILVLTGGGPIRSTETLGFFMYMESVVFFKQGYGAAATVVLTLIVMLVAIPLMLNRSEVFK